MIDLYERILKEDIEDSILGEADEHGYFKEDLECIESVKSKLSAKQRAFIDYFKEAVDEKAEAGHEAYKHLVFLGAIDLFDRKPEFCPNASIEFLKKNVKRKHYADEFAEIVEIMTTWSDKVRASKKPVNRRAARMARLSKVFLYPAFVLIFSFTLMQGINIYEHFAFGIEINWGKQILVILIALYMTRILGKAVLFKGMPKNIDI